MKTCASMALILAAALALSGVGCARKPSVLFAASDMEIVWPSPPDPPRIRYVGEIRSTAALKPSRTFGEAMGDFFLGKKPPVAMVSPLGVCADRSGRIFIADSGAQALHVYDLKAARYQRWSPPPDAPAFQQPVAVTCDMLGNVIVSDSVAAALFVFRRDGGFSRVLGGDSLVRPCGAAVRPSTGEIYVADAGAHEVVVLGADGSLRRRIGARGAGPGEFNFPTHVVFDSAERLYVADSLNFRVQAFDQNDKFERAIGVKGDVPGTFSQPKGLALGPDDHLFVVDANFEAVQVFDPEGHLLLTFGQEGRGPGEFWLPNGAGFDGSGRLWIADSYNQRVQAFQYLTPGDAP